MSFLSPLILAGFGLLALPWLIHRIRRPERETVRFSSLMFVPEAKREVIERRRVQHILLMLLRMAILALLALAFSRPFHEVVSRSDAGSTSAGDHVILFDVSASMAGEIRFEAARRAALRTIADLPAESRVAVLQFARSATVVMPLADPNRPEAGSPEAGREAVRSLSPTWESTDYVAGLQAAERLLGAADGQEGPRFIHLVSDMQASGLAERESGWRLPADVRLASVPVLPPLDNAAVEEVALRHLEDRIEVRARVRNYGDRTRELTARLILADATSGEERLVVPAGNATQALFRIEHPLDRSAIAGHVEIDADDLLTDNRRYFAWNPDRIREVRVLSESWRDARLLLAAVPPETGLPWRVQPVSRAALANLPRESPDVLIAPHLNTLSAADLRRMDAYVRSGGSLFLLPGSGTRAEPLLALLGDVLDCQGPRRSGAGDAGFDRITWVDLAHPVFYPFRAPTYSDFSDLRFSNHTIFHPRADGVGVLARFEPRSQDVPGDPAVIEVARGRGRVLIWTAGIDPAWSTLSRGPRFVPWLHETLSYLAGKPPALPAFLVGDPITTARHALGAPGPLLLEFATGAAPTRIAVGTEARVPLERPGLYTWRSEANPNIRRTDAVNVDPRESDPLPLEEAELQLRLAGADPVVPAGAALPETVGPEGGLRIEYGRIVLAVALLALGVESILARRRGHGKEAA